MKKYFALEGILIALVALLFWLPRAEAQSTWYTQFCSSCHGTALSTCNGCHAHGTHATSSKNTINIAGTTNKTSYAPGETVSVTVTGGYRTGWVRVILYDQNMTELARSTGTIASGAQAPSGAPGFPVTLTTSAPVSAGTYTWNVAWYGNQYDLTEANAGTTFFGPRWTPDPTNPNHGQEVVSVKAFSVTGTPAAPHINLNPSSLNLGTVTVGGSAAANTLIQNTGTASLTVSSIARCTGTSTEYTWSPTAMPLTIPAGGSTTLAVTYAPIAAGSTSGCLNVSSNDSTTPVAVLNVSGSGSTAPPTTYNVTPSWGANGSISPSSVVTVNANGVASFTVTPNVGYQIASVTGCGGTLSGSTYTTGPVSADCTVSATFSASSTGGGGGAPGPTPVGYSPFWMVITLVSLMVVGGILLRRKKKA
jgi:hypothetical protein